MTWPNEQSNPAGATPSWVVDPATGYYIVPNVDGSLNVKLEALPTIDIGNVGILGKNNTTRADVGGGTAAESLRVNLATDVALPAGTNVIGKAGIDQTTPGTTNRIVSQKNVTVSINLTVTTGSAYASGNCVGGLQTLDVSSLGTLGGLLQSISVMSLSGVTTEIDMIGFNANPTGSTFTDKAAAALAQADFASVIPGLPVSASYSFNVGTPTCRVVQNLAVPFSSTTIYLAFITRGTPTFSDAHDTQVQLGLIFN